MTYRITLVTVLALLLAACGKNELLGWRHWTPELRRWFWLIVPPWLLLHASLGLLRETRLLLVPYALLLLPGLLLALTARGGPAPGRPDPRSLPS
jgi:hypothetical protein